MIKVSISPCPNDTFMFEAIINKRINCSGYKFEFDLKDIDRLNSDVVDILPDISKISYAAYPDIADKYIILNSGSAVGYGNAPLVVSRTKIYPDELSSCKIAIPGEKTTANTLLKFALGSDMKLNSVPYLFSDIADVIMSGECDAGVLIHEERFTYAKKGLSLVMDLGKEWENKKHLPIPLGAIVARRDLGPKIISNIEKLINESIRFAYDNPGESYNFVRSNARELSDDVLESHIKMFVNPFSLSLEREGRDAVIEFLEVACGHKYLEGDIFNI